MELDTTEEKSLHKDEVGADDLTVVEGFEKTGKYRGER